MQVLKDKDTQARAKPFIDSSGIACRCYSLPLQRVMTDFGADESFSGAVKKIKEHYGIEISMSATQRITEKHAEQIHLGEESRHQKMVSTKQHSSIATKTIISEIDGSMVPIVEFSLPADKTAEEVDLRKHRKLVYKEARLALSREQGSVSPVYAATMGDVHEAGKQLRCSAEAVGLNEKTKIHGVGDGAPWIAIQFENQFAAQSTYLIDFYHLCEYLAKAAESIPDNRHAWIEQQKDSLKKSQSHQVLMALKPYLEPNSVSDENAPVRACYRYIENRPDQFYYKEALEKELPIGSGEVESEHRYISQKRLKLAGAWWKDNNAANILSLRVLRANNNWDSYWSSVRLDAA